MERREEFNSLERCYLQTLIYAKGTVQWQGSRTYWTGQNTKKYWFTVCCFKSDDL